MLNTGLALFKPTHSLVVPAETHEVEFAPNGDPVLSPSQVTTYLMCPRKWAARYLHGQHEPVGAGTVAGKRMHSILEHYYERGEVPSKDTPEGAWALELIRSTRLPMPVPGAKRVSSGPVPERKFKFEYEGVWWRGSKDLTYLRDGLYVIRDHKSTSELNPLWVKTEAQLAVDPQSVIYALEAFLSDNPEDVECEWGYVTRTKYPKTELHRIRMTLDMVVHGMERLTRMGHEMLRAYRERPALNDLPSTGATNGGCEAFGGCKVTGCNVTALDRIRGQQLFNTRKQGAHDMGYMDDLRARQAQTAALSGQPTTPVAPGPTLTVTSYTPPPAEPPAPAPQAQVPDIRTRLAQAANPGASVAPPPFTPPAGVAQQAPVAPTVQQAPAPSPADAPKRGRGRARAAAPAPSSQEVIDTVGQAVGEEAVRAASTPLPDVILCEEAHPPADPIDFSKYQESGFQLCINCAPVGGSIVLFSQYVAPVHAAIKAEKGWPNYNLASFEGKAHFQTALQQYLEHSPPVGCLVVDARTDEGRDALPTLERFATNAPIRGF